jgi:ubiquinone/menaquinone biosynthesis C-methylase UbiE
MKLKTIQKNWEGFANTDPMWSILTNRNFIHSRWNKEEFFLTGENDVNNWFSGFEELQHLKNGAALDFGCGMGRLTQALCNRFISVTGVDISKTMIALANENNKYPNKCSYYLNEHNNLKNFGNNSFDFIVSHITLQHLPKNYIFNYIEEFIRIIKPGGIILFSLPSKPPFIYRLFVRLFSQVLINRFRRVKYKTKYVMEMHWIDEKKMKEFIEPRGKLLNMNPNFSVGRNWEGYMYVVSK